MTGAARECGVSKALLYHYHHSKEALLFDILDVHLAELVRVADGALGQGMRGLIAALLDAYEDADAEHKLQLEALGALPPEMQAPLVAHQRRLVAVVSDLVAETRPDLGPDRLRAAVMTVFAILNWVYMWHRPNKGLSRTDYAALAADFVEGGLSRI